MRRRRTPFLVATVLVAAGLAACDSGPDPGFVTVELVSPQGAEGAFLVEVRGGAAGAAVSADGTVFRHAVAGGERVAVIRDGAGPLSFRLEVADRGEPPAVELLQVAGPDDVLRADLGPYALEVR